MKQATLTPFRWTRILWPHSLLNARSLILRGLMAIAFFAVAHALGLRHYVTVVSGTSPTGDPLDARMALLGGIYVLAWLTFVVAAPILLLAGAILIPFERRNARMDQRATSNAELLSSRATPKIL